jgi:hypothetical protein
MKGKPDDPEQSKRFIEMARQIEVDEGPETIDRAFRKVVAAAPKRPPRKSEKGDRLILRSSCSVVDTRSLQYYLGHKSIQHTVRYTELAPDRFKGFWRD